MSVAHPEHRADEVAWLTEIQMIEVDRVMMDELGIDLVRMMENAGRNLAQLAIDRFAPATVAVFGGSGGNGGGGYVAARHLANRGVSVRVITTRTVDEVRGVPGEQLRLLERMGVEFVDDPAAALAGVDLALDAVIGYSLRGAPSGRGGALVAALAATEVPVLSLDTPSGLDVTTGDAPGWCVAATATMTLAQPKQGLRASPAVGELYCADISVPPSVYEGMGVRPALGFTTSPIVRVVLD